jgi:tetratricopeptide (TPR) repeat protein
MIRSSIALALAAIALPVAAISQTSAFDRGRTARSNNRLADAERAFEEVLRADPNHYRARYNLCLVYESRAVQAPAGAPRLAGFRKAAGCLEQALRMPQRGASGEHAYTIFNTLGLIYLALGNYERANQLLQEGFRNRGRLSDFSRGRLFANMGYLYAVQGDVANARKFFSAGARLNSRFAAENIRRLDAAGIR